MRLIQGLALGGEYGGAATYVAEHAPEGKRGLYTSWIQTTATFGLFLSLIVIIVVRTQLGEDAFKAWGWRIPFLVSAVLLVVSLWIRLRLNESPVFQKMVDEGTDLEGAAHRELRQVAEPEAGAAGAGRASPPARRWSGTPASSTPCSSWRRC